VRSKNSQHSLWISRVAARLVQPAAAALFIAAWHLLSLSYPPFILPGPAAVAERFVDRTADGTLPMHIATTAGEALPGLLFGTIAALLLGYPAAHSRWADKLISPLVVATQGVPLIAVAPLIFIWFGSGYGAKVLVCTIIVFFPIVVNVTSGLRSVPAQLSDLFTMLGASRLDAFLKLELPAALPFIFAGLRTGSALSMIGALTGEFLSSSRGLGFLINQATGLYDTALVLAAILSTVATSLSIHACIRALERIVIHSHTSKTSR
jgi:NitT/TauT family transport system permease protein